MTEVATATAVHSKSPKKAAKAKKPKTAPTHPPVIDMIKAAIKNLKERNGSSRQAIVKYISANYKVDEKLTSHIKRQLRSGVTSGKLVHTKGTGASGSFKLPASAKDAPKKSAAKPKKTAAAKKSPAKKKTAAKKPVAKKTAAAKPKKASSAKKPAVKKAVVAKKPSVKKPAAKKTAKPAAAKKATPKKKVAKK